jgi:hypothetical protein
LAGRMEPAQKNLIIPKRYELNLTFFASRHFKEDRRKKIVLIFIAARDLLEKRKGDIFWDDIYALVRKDMTEAEFIFLYRFTKDILCIFKRGYCVKINEKCEFIIDCEPVV